MTVSQYSPVEEAGPPRPPWQWSSSEALTAAVDELGHRPGLVDAAATRALTRQLADVTAGEAFVLQAGDCAEMFAEVSRHTTARKAAQVTELAELIETGTALPTVGVGRLAGQFAKPRSRPTEACATGDLLPVYRGDAVNGVEATVWARRPDPARLLTAYTKAAEVLGYLAALPGRPVWVAHESLLSEYETPLVRSDPRTGADYGSSAHLLWLGERNREPDGIRARLLARIANPVAVKLGPSATAGDVAALVDRLDPERLPGRLTFICRLGVGMPPARLPTLVAAARNRGAAPVWICDPMHGNTIQTGTGQKTRVLEDLLTETVEFVSTLRRLHVHPGGIHLEISPDDVTECVDAHEDAHANQPLARYWTACDPRLSPTQARTVVAAFVEALIA